MILGKALPVIILKYKQYWRFKKTLVLVTRRGSVFGRLWLRAFNWISLL